MAIDETITGNNTSTEFIPTGSLAEVLVEAESDGLVSLEEKAGGDWHKLTDATGAYVVSTPDYANVMTYRFRAHGLTDSVRVFMESL